MKKAYAVLFFWSIFAACNKSPKETSVSNPPLLRMTSCSPENSDNDFDDVGMWHNLGMAFAVANGDTTITGFTASAIEFADANYGGPGVNNVSEQVANILSDAENDFENITAGKGFSNSMMSRITQLKSILNDDLPNTETSGLYCYLKQEIVMLEGEIMTDNNLSTTEKNALLGACSIARFSMYYQWTNFDDPAEFHLSPDDIKVIFADVAAYLDSDGNTTVAMIISGLTRQGLQRLHLQEQH